MSSTDGAFAVVVQADDLLVLSTVVVCPSVRVDSHGELPPGGDDLGRADASHVRDGGRR